MLKNNVWTGDVLFSQAVAHLLSSPQRRLTTLFGMGRGSSTSLSSPDQTLLYCYYSLKPEEDKPRFAWKSQIPNPKIQNW